MSTHTYGSALALIGATVPPHLAALDPVPVLTGPQAQGDLLVVPEPPRHPRWEPVPAEGITVVRGEATGNTHWLHAGFDSPGVRWWPAERGLVHGYLFVPPGQTALLIHTDEHGANGVGPGTYAIRGKREEGQGVGSQPVSQFVHD